jgi:membrane-associated HD superfamily phosphohydrolase
MELEQLKKDWQELSEKIEKSELFNKELTMNMLKKNAKSSVNKLEKYEFLFLIISVMYTIFLALALFVNDERLIVNESIWASIAIFVIAGGWQAFKLILLQQMRFDSCSTIEMMNRVTRYKILTKARLYWGMSLLIPFFAIVMYFQRDIFTPELMVAMVIGGSLGAVIGLSAYRKHWKNIDELLSDLKEIKSYEKL